MSKSRVFLSSPTMHGEELGFIQEAFDTNWIAPIGNNINQFEQELASFVGIESWGSSNVGNLSLTFGSEAGRGEAGRHCVLLGFNLRSNGEPGIL